MTDDDTTPDTRPATPASKRAWVWFFGFGAFVAGLGFCVKIFEFSSDLFANEGIQFAGVHLLTYSLVAVGFFLLLGFAFFTGHFADIEAPKFDLIDRERGYDRRDYT